MIPDCKIELIYVGTGTTKSPGGQHAGTPPSSIRMTHIPSGIIAEVPPLSASQHIQKSIAEEMILAALTCKYSNRI